MVLKALFAIFILIAFCGCSIIIAKYCVDRTTPPYITERPVIFIKYLTDILPVEISAKGDWIDLRCAEDVHLDKNEYDCLPLGVAMKLPDGYSAIIAPRSSTFDTWKIIQTNSIGVIDNIFCGDNDEWLLPVLALDDTDIKKNDRICQFRIIRNDEPELVTVKQLGHENRGGFGSTGRR